MKRSMIVSIILCITLLFSTSAVAFANSNITEVSNKKLVEVFTFGVDYGLSEEITMERITEDNNVTVRIFDSNGNLIIQSRREGDDICVMDYSDPNNPMDITEELVKMFNISENEYDIISDSASGIKSINWGSWTTYSTQVDTEQWAGQDITFDELTPLENYRVSVTNPDSNSWNIETLYQDITSLGI